VYTVALLKERGFTPYPTIFRCSGKWLLHRVWDKFVNRAYFFTLLNQCD
jgi:hypothetical protein